MMRSNWRSETNGPSPLCSSHGKPIGSASTRRTSSATTSSCTAPCTNTREVELHDCPWRFMFMPCTAAAAAFFGSASGKMMIGFLPPSSSVTGDGASGRYRADEADAAHLRMAHQAGADSAVAGNDIDHTRGKDSVAQL